MNSQIFFPLTHLVTFERSVSLVCIPDRDSADCELTQLRNKYGTDLLKAVIRKDRSSRSGSSRTYTLRYTVREQETRTLF